MIGDNDLIDQGNRLQYMDLAKGIGVCFVILGHMPSVVPEPIRMWIFSFHMPLFYFISGYFARTYVSNQGLFRGIIRKFKYLIVLGYLSFGLVFCLLDMLLHKLTLQEALTEIKFLLMGNTYRVTWFLLSLFIVEVVFVLVTMFAKTIRTQFIICVLIVGAGYMLGIIGWNDFRIGSSFYAYGFYYLGHMANKYSALKIDKRSIGLVIVAILISIIGTILFLRISPMVLDINCNTNHDIVANYAIALGGSYSVLFLSMILCNGKCLLPIRILGYIGKNSFFFFTITNYVPETFTTLVHSKGIVAKIGAYMVGAAIACFLSEIVSYKKKM